MPLVSRYLALAASVVAVLALNAATAAAAKTHEHALPEQLYVGNGCLGHEHSEDSIVVFASVVDCTITEDTGFAQGEPFDIDVVQIDGKAVEVDTANAFLVMQAAAELDGVALGISSGFRTFEEQEYLYGCYINCNCNNCNLAAQPGYSNHNSGHALDLNTASPGVYDWLDANAADFGFERTVPSEDWHWEWWGGGPGGGQCARACPLVPKDGRIIEETDDCFYGGGQTQYLREVQGGHGGRFLWTKATDSEEPSNYGLWRLTFAVAGRYELLAYTDDGEFGQSTQAGYLVTHADGDEVVRIDQTSADGWLSLGVFSFSSDEEFSVRLNDNTGEPWAEDPGGVRIMFDALQALPIEGDDGGNGGNGGGGEDPEDPEDPGDVIGGCSAADRGAIPMWFGLLCLLALVRRRA